MSHSSTNFNLKQRIQSFIDRLRKNPEKENLRDKRFLENDSNTDQKKIEKCEDTTAKKKNSKNDQEEKNIIQKNCQQEFLSLNKKLNFENVLGSKTSNFLNNSQSQTNWSDPNYHKNDKEMTIASNLIEKKSEKNLKTPSKKIKIKEDIGTTAKKRRVLDPDRKFKEDKMRSSQGNESVFTSNLKKRKRIVTFSKASGKNLQKKKMIKLKKRKKKFLKLRNSEGRKFTYEIFDDAVLNLPLKIQLKVIKAKNDDDFDTDEDQCQTSSYYCLKEVEEAQSHILRRKKLI